MFIWALCITKNWKQPKYTIIGEGLSKPLWYIRIVKYKSEIKRNEALLHTVWVDFKRIYAEWGTKTISEGTYYLLIDSMLKWRCSLNEEQVSDCQGLRLGLGSDSKGVVPGNFSVIMEQLHIVIVVVVTQISTCGHTHLHTYTHVYVHVKVVKSKLGL